MKVVGRLFLLSGLGCGTTACTSPAPDMAAYNTQIDNLTTALRARDGEIANLTAELSQTKAKESASASKPGTVDPDGYSAADVADQNADARRSATAENATRMCYKDYCPCDPPQGGMDTVVCDQLEEGLEVPIESMIAGRGFREARRQMTELDK